MGGSAPLPFSIARLRVGLLVHLLRWSDAPASQLLSRINIIRGAKSINHAQIVDDTLLIGGASSTIASQFKHILDSFLDASRGLLNN
jgi:hypothetical protein